MCQNLIFFKSRGGGGGGGGGGGVDYIIDQAGHNCAIFDSIWYLLHIPYHTWSI